jgi:protein O-mannosyl-transferase
VSPRRLYLAVAAAAVVVYLGALANRFAMDDLPLVAQNPLVNSGSGLWRAFAAAYWPADLGGTMYRPLTVASWALDRMIDGTLWYHLVNILWHAAACVTVAALARRLADDPTALIAGLLFAVHPVHVEAVANVVGRAELMAGVFVGLAVYAALVRGSVGWSAAAWTLGLLCKENAAVLPALVVWAWMIGVRRPPRRRMVAFLVSWLVIGAAYAVLRLHVLGPYARFQVVGPIFLGQSPLTIRLTAVATLADVARLLVWPLHLRADYSPAERTVVQSPGDLRFLTGVVCLLVWGTLLALAWRRRRRLEALGLGWVGIAFLPVANLVFPAGFLLAERTLYLPSVGLALAAGTWLVRLPVRWRLVPTAALVLLGGVRTALRVPVWRDNATVTLSILEDSPRSYVGPKRMIAIYLDLHQPDRALEAARRAAAINEQDPTIYATGAVAAFAAGRPQAADSLLAGLERLCRRCVGYYRQESVTARRHGYVAAADSLEARARAMESP